VNDFGKGKSPCCKQEGIEPAGIENAKRVSCSRN
jgi:hypothetical protein